MSAKPPSGHEKHCFIVMPFGRTDEDVKWFQGWYEAVIKPAVLDAGYEPKVSFAEEKPSAINDEIRSHLVFDRMVVCDLGGRTPEDPPNPNVMYELGIRHAFGFPHVVMAWKGQQLPFDVGNQRAIMEGRDFIDIEITKQKLKSFIASAASGQFYRPMEAVGLTAAIEQIASIRGQDDLLVKLSVQMKNMHNSLSEQIFRQGQKISEVESRLHETLPEKPSAPWMIGNLLPGSGGVLGANLSSSGGVSLGSALTPAAGFEIVRLPDGAMVVRPKLSGKAKDEPSDSKP